MLHLTQLFDLTWSSHRRQKALHLQSLQQQVLPGMLHMPLHSRPQIAHAVTDAFWVQFEGQLNALLLHSGFLCDELPQDCQAGQVVAS